MKMDVDFHLALTPTLRVTRGARGVVASGVPPGTSAGAE